MIYLNGRLLPDEETRISPADRGLLLGDGLFETMRAYQGEIFRLRAHLHRLLTSADFLGIPIPDVGEELSQALARTLEANDLSHSDASLRLTLTRGVGPRGLVPPRNTQPTLLITAAPLERTEFPPATAILASVCRNEHSPLANLKTLNYLDNILARQEAVQRGADEALLRNTAGNLAEASAANLFVVFEGVLRSPPLSDGALPGITRGVVMELAQELDIPLVEASLSPERLFEADEAFLTNSLIEVRPLLKVNGREIGDGEVGEITRRIRAGYRKEIE
ncbi:MAG: D-alanine aminotransferase [Chloroflexi bacterium]|nr:D-alanine aminotransferase [Chloroflexota bacterium]